MHATGHAAVSKHDGFFVCRFLFQLSLYGDDYAELIHVGMRVTQVWNNAGPGGAVCRHVAPPEYVFTGNSIAQQVHAGGKQEIFSTAPKPAIYQQTVNLFMNVYILRHHLQLTLQVMRVVCVMPARSGGIRGGLLLPLLFPVLALGSVYC